jgi:hypothetical protein
MKGNRVTGLPGQPEARFGVEETHLAVEIRGELGGGRGIVVPPLSRNRKEKSRRSVQSDAERLDTER